MKTLLIVAVVALALGAIVQVVGSEANAGSKGPVMTKEPGQ